jgi:hypothetical protein
MPWAPTDFQAVPRLLMLLNGYRDRSGFAGGPIDEARVSEASTDSERTPMRNQRHRRVGAGIGRALFNRSTVSERCEGGTS